MDIFHYCLSLYRNKRKSTTTATRHMQYHATSASLIEMCPPYINCNFLSTEICEPINRWNNRKRYSKKEKEKRNPAELNDASHKGQQKLMCVCVCVCLFLDLFSIFERSKYPKPAQGVGSDSFLGTKIMEPITYLFNSGVLAWVNVRVRVRHIFVMVMVVSRLQEMNVSSLSTLTFISCPLVY